MTKIITGGNGILYGKDILCSSELTMQEITKLLEIAIAMKADRFNQRYVELLKNKSFLMLFYSPSFRTHLSFSTAMTELGGMRNILSHLWVVLKKKGLLGKV